jgi:2-oxoglutarate ferredoxin oxidoreductase subunit beta
LTKGQCSPTSRAGTRSPSTPYGSVEKPINPCGFALGAGARFVARSYDVAQSKLPDVLKRAHSHRGASFVEIYQNCIVYNDGAFEKFAGKKAAADAVLWLEAGKPMLFASGTKGLRLDRDRLKLEVVSVADQNSVSADVLVHDETDKSIAQLLIDMPFGSFPMALGVIYYDPTPAFDSTVIEQNNKASAGKMRDLNALLRRGDTWSVDGNGRIEIG